VSASAHVQACELSFRFVIVCSVFVCMLMCICTHLKDIRTIIVSMREPGSFCPRAIADACAFFDISPTCTHTHKHTYIYAHTYTRAHTPSLSHTHTNIHTHTHTYTLSPSFFLILYLTYIHSHVHTLPSISTNYTQKPC